MQNTFDTFFHYISKGIIFVPIIIIIIALIMKGTSNNKVQIVIVPSPTVIVVRATPTPSLWEEIKDSTIAASFNLTGPFSCNVKDSDKNMELEIASNQVYVSYVKNKESKKGLLQGDCFYSWNDLLSKGEKICGISPYLSLLESMSLQSLLSNPLLSSVIKGKEKDIVKLMLSCVKKPVLNRNVFYVPVNVVFSSK
jgi:hypothetical protein